MKILVIIFLFAIVAGCFSKKRDNLELEYGVFNQTFSQLEPTSCLYQNEYLYTNDSAFSREQKQFIKKYLSNKNIDTINLNFKHIELFFLKDSIKKIKYPEYKDKETTKLNIEKINGNSKAILVLASDTLFMNRMNFNKKIELSRVLFNSQRTKAIYEISTIFNENLAYNKYLVYSNLKNGAWYVYKAERRNYEQP